MSEDQTNIESHSETNENSEKKFNTDSFDGKFEPTSDIKHILGKTIKISGREKFKVDHRPESKFDKVEEDGKVWKYTVSTVEKFDAPVKKETVKVSKWYVTESHYRQLEKIAPDQTAKTLDTMLKDGIITPELVPCKRKGGQFGKYYSWLTPNSYEQSLKDDEIITQ